MTSLTNVEAVRKMAAKLNVEMDYEQVRMLATCISCQKYKKGEIILNENEVCEKLSYVEQGMARQFYYKDKKEVTEHLGYEESFVVCVESYLKQIPTHLMIEALEPLVLWSISKTEIERLSSENAMVGIFYRKIIEKCLLQSQIKADTMRFESAQNKYLKLLRLHPEIVKRAPLVHIASFLQITPETLSRIRASVLSTE